MTKTVVVDSDAIFALYNPNDPLHGTAMQTMQQLIAKNYELIYPSPVIFEVISLFQRVLPTPTVTARLIEMIQNDQFAVIFVDADMLQEAARLFNPFGSKKHTLIDCSVAAVAKRVKAKGIFSYDSFFTKQGLRLAKDLVTSG